MAHLMLFMAMPFLGIRIGLPMLSGTGSGNVAPSSTPSLNFSDATQNYNTVYLTMGLG